MKKLAILLIVSALPVSGLGQPLFTGDEWKVDSYASVENKIVEMTIPAAALKKSVFRMNEKNRLSKIDETTIYSLRGREEYKILPSVTIRNKEYLPIETSGDIYYLAQGDFDFLPLMRNWSVYDDLLEMMNERYVYMKPPVSNFALGEPSFHGKAHTITWHRHSHNMSGYGRYDITFSFSANNTARIHTVEIGKLDRSDFLTRDEVIAIEREAEARRIADSLAAVAQRRIDSLEDGRVHAFRLSSAISSVEAEARDTVFLYGDTKGYFRGRFVDVPSYNSLRPVMLTDDHQYKTYGQYKEYVSRRGDEGLERRMQIAWEADSIQTQRYLVYLYAKRDSIMAERDKIIKRLVQRQSFIIVKEYAYADYGNFGLELTFFNYFRKTIKYVVFETKPYNRFGDLQPDRVGKTSSRARCIGPIEPQDAGTYEFEELYYDPNDVISHIVVTKLVITFLDDTTVTITDVNNHIGEGVYNKTK